MSIQVTTATGAPVRTLRDASRVNAIIDGTCRATWRDGDTIDLEARGLHYWIPAQEYPRLVSLIQTVTGGK